MARRCGRDMGYTSIVSIRCRITGKLNFALELLEHLQDTSHNRAIFLPACDMGVAIGRYVT